MELVLVCTSMLLASTFEDKSIHCQAILCKIKIHEHVRMIRVPALEQILKSSPQDLVCFLCWGFPRVFALHLFLLFLFPIFSYCSLFVSRKIGKAQNQNTNSANPFLLGHKNREKMGDIFNDSPSMTALHLPSY